MEIIPLIQIKDRNIEDTTIQEIILDKNKVFKDKIIYFLDFDGIDKNKPNLCSIQKLSKNYDLIVDSAPKNLGDVVDIFMSGAGAIVVRKKYYKNFNPIEIKEISENKVFQFLEKENMDFIEINDYIDGYVFLDRKKDSYLEILNNPSFSKIKNKLYVREEDIYNNKYLEKKEIKALIVDFKKFKEFI